MVIDKQNNHIVKQSSGTVWNFFYSSKSGILFRIYKDTVWSLSKNAAKDGTENFSVVLTQADKIILIYQDIYGNIILSNYTQDNWIPEILMKRKKGTYCSIFFDAVVLNNDIHIVYCIPDENSGKYALIHQTSPIGEKLHQPVVIDVLSSTYNIPFYLYINSENVILFYQDFKNTWEFGCRQYMKDHKSWSSFTVIDHSKYPFKDISFTYHDKLNYIAYIKKDDKDHLSFYSFKDYSMQVPYSLCKDDKIENCCIFTFDEQIWINWITHDACSSSFSCDNGKNWSHVFDNRNLKIPPVKAKFLYSKEQNMKLSVNEFLIEDINTLKIFTISELYPHIFNKSMQTDISCVSEKQTYVSPISEHINITMNEYYAKLLAYQKQEAEYEEKIKKLNTALSQYAGSCENIKKSNNELSYRYYKLLDENKKITSSLSELQEESVNNHRHINNIEKKLIDNEEIALNFQKENEELKHEKDILTVKCDDYINQIKNLQNENAEMNTSLNNLKSQLEKSKEPFGYFQKFIKSNKS